MANNTTQFTIKINGTQELVTLDKLINQNAQSVGELKDQQDALNQAFEQAVIGTEAYDSLQSSLRSVNTQLKVIDESVADLTIAEKFEGVGRIVGAVGGAFAFASVSVQAFGDENSKTAEELQKLETQISAIIQGQQALTGIIDAFGSKNKIVAATLNTLSKGFNAVGISAKGAGLAVRGALIATGIGILVAAVSALIVNFDEIKEAGAGIFKAWQPFFDGVRNFASTLTFGLIDNAATARLNNQIESISESITKTQETTTKKLDDINTQFELKQVSNLQKAQAVVSTLQDQLNQVKDSNTNILGKIISTKDIIEFEDKAAKFTKGLIGAADRKEFDDLTKAVKDQLLEQNRLRSIIADNVKRGVLTTKDIDDFKIGFERTIKDLTPLVNDFKSKTSILRFTGGDEALDKLNDFYDLIIPKEKQLPIIATNLNKQLQIQNELTKAGITEADVRIAKLNEEARITKEIANLQQQINQEQNKRSEDNNDLLKQGIDLILSFGNALKSPEFQNDLPVFENFKSQLEFISKNLKGTFKGIFDDILKQSPETIVSVETLTNAIKKYGEEKIRTSTLNRNTSITNLQAEIDLNKELIKNSTDSNFIKVKEKQNQLLSEQIETLRDSAQKTKDEILGATQVLISSITRTVDAAKFEDQARDLEKAKMAFEDYKNGLELSTEQVSLLFEKLGVDGKVAYETLTNEAKNAIDSNVTNKLVEQLTLLKEQAKQLAVLFPELKNTVNQYNDAIDGVIRSQKETNKQTSETIKLLQQELALLIQAEEIRNLQAIADNPSTTNAAIKARIEAVQKIAAIEQKNIKDKFEAETKGLKETDAAYQIAIINRNKAEEELGKQTSDKILAIQTARQQAIIDGINESISLLTNATGEIFSELTAQNQAAIERLQEEAAKIQEQITLLDTVINEKTALIDSLTAKAAEAQGSQRAEILRQLENETKATQNLIKEKRRLQAEETANAAKQAAIEKQNVKLQKEAAVVNQIAALSTATLAVAKAFNPDPVSANLPLGVGLAIRATAAIAFAATLFGLIGQLTRLSAEGGFVKDAPVKKRADGGYTGSSTLRPDETGERPMYHTVQLHEKEWVAPRWMTESPKYGSLINELEQSRVRGFADGGSIAPLTSQSISNEQLTGLLVANLNRPVYVAVTDINLGQSRVKVLENRGTI
jgi:hypothetical protein